MRAYEISEIREFTSHLFAGEAFDTLLMAEAEFHTRSAFFLKGKLDPDFLEPEEENPEGYISWREVKPICFSIIRGKRLPKSFKIVFKMGRTFSQRWLREQGASPENTGELFWNIRYQKKKLHLISSFSYKSFTLDKALERAWDDSTRLLFKKIGIVLIETGRN